MSTANLNSIDRSNGPRLLVSVRNASEAAAALAGGADIIDVKEPAQGPLGSASTAVIEAVANELRRNAKKSIPLSAALGELRELEGLPQLPRECVWVKCGLSGLIGTHWRPQWSALQREFRHRSPSIELIPVVYVDGRACAAPPPEEIMGVAMDTRAPGILFDTFEKRGQTLVDALPIRVLRDFIDWLHVSRRFVALAGSLRLAQIPDLVKLWPDILAVRSAACVGGRQGHVDAQHVAALKTAIENHTPGARRAVSGSQLKKNPP